MDRAQVLVVEDEAVVAMDIQSKLEELGYSVIALIRSGEEAVQTACEMRPDLILMDIKLHGDFDGISAAACIQECNPTPVVYMTAHGDKDTLHRANMTEPLGYIIKPFDEQDLRAAIEVALTLGVKKTEQKLAEKALRQSKDGLELAVVERTTELRTANERLEQSILELRQTQEQVVQQERLRALGTMASGIAHDLNNALAPVLGYSDLMLNHPDILRDSDRVKQYLQRMKTSATEGAEVVNRVREFYRHREDADVVGPVDLNFLVVQTVEVTEPRWKDMAQSTGTHVAVETDLDPEQPIVAGSESNLRTVLTNLIINGLDAMPSGGTLTISTHSSGTTVELIVSDTGFGMTDDVRRRAIEPFFTTKADSGGSGLGLAMVHGIIERHGGQLDIQSELGKGTNFVIRLPRANPQPEIIEPAKVVESTRTLRVLVVDDEDLVRDLIVEYLTSGGDTVEAASNGKEALEKFKPGHFDLIITDRSMPGINGDQLAAAVKEVDPDIPIIMLTGFGEVMDTAREHLGSVDSVMSKPITEYAMRQAIAQVLGEWSLRRGSPEGPPV